MAETGSHRIRSTAAAGELTEQDRAGVKLRLDLGHRAVLMLRHATSSRVIWDATVKEAKAPRRQRRTLRC
jgi:hypothetical protein